MKKVIIVGGGPAGLSAAYLINKKYPEIKVRVLEKAGIFGGAVELSQMVILHLIWGLIIFIQPIKRLWISFIR